MTTVLPDGVRDVDLTGEGTPSSEPPDASESEVIRDGLRALAAGDQAIEAWLSERVLPAYDRLSAEPDRAITGEQVRARLSSAHTS